MMSNVQPVMKTVLLTALAAALCLGASCKKSDAVKTPPTKQPAPATAQKDAQKQAQPPAQPPATAPAPQQTAQAPNGAKMVAINIELPKPMFVGTPQDIKVENLEKPLGKPRPPFLAPEGTVNLAKGKPVSASDEEPIIGDIAYVTDGDKEAADGSYVELAPFVQHVTIDLGKECEIYAIVLWHYHKQPRVYYDVVVQLADDKDFVTGVKTVFNNDVDNSAGLGIGKNMHYIETSEGKLIDCLSQGSPKARFVRLYSNGNNSNDLNHYIEVEVFGKPVQ
jgi:hypothetical protein